MNMLQTTITNNKMNMSQTREDQKWVFWFERRQDRVYLKSLNESFDLKEDMIEST